MHLRKRILRCLVVLLLLPTALAAATIYVDDDAPGGDGTSWATAFKYLQDALAAADANDVIRVAQGTYVPDQNSVNPGGSGDREATFELINGLAIYGGYAGYGAPDPNDRDIKAYETILSGDLDGNDVVPSSPEYLLDEPTRSENCYHIVTSVTMMMFETVVLDGLTITAGHANGIEYPRYLGGGVYNEHYGPTMTVDCTFKDNCARSGGGGMYNEHSSLTIVDCTFKNNCAGFGGGGMYCRHLDFTVDSSISNCVFVGNFARYGAGIANDHVDEITLDVVNCVFADNVATDGGGAMANRESDLHMKKCVFSNNSAGAEGGAMFNDHGDVRLTDCIISGNFAGSNGGGISSEHLRVWLTNCTIVGNEAGEQGGGVFDYVDQDRHVTNCIFWDNIAYEGPQMAIRGEVDAFIRYSCFQGGRLDIHHDGTGSVSWADGNNTDADPIFVDPGHWDTGVWIDGDYHLQWDSPCINVGDPGGDYVGQVGIDGEPRVMGGRVDMGADEVGEKQADFTRDGKIDTEDLGVFVQSWLSSSDDIDWYILCDLYEDDGIEFADFAEFAKDWLWQADWYEP